jgi:hypothetical protein
VLRWLAPALLAAALALLAVLTLRLRRLSTQLGAVGHALRAALRGREAEARAALPAPLPAELAALFVAVTEARAALRDAENHARAREDQRRALEAVADVLDEAPHRARACRACPCRATTATAP